MMNVEVSMFEESGITVITKAKFQEMVDFVINDAPDDFLLELMHTPEDRVAGIYHMTAGAHIRRIFALWEVKFKPKLEDGVDCSPDHPDNISSVVILAARRALLAKAESMEM
jgi:hypothetical protein